MDSGNFASHRKLFLLGTNTKKSSNTIIGCATNLGQLFESYLRNDPKTPREIKNSKSPWFLCLVIVIPPNFRHDLDAIQERWKTKHRGIMNRTAYGIKSIAARYKLPMFISRDVLDNVNHPIIETIKKDYDAHKAQAMFIEEQENQLAITRLRELHAARDQPEASR